MSQSHKWTFLYLFFVQEVSSDTRILHFSNNPLDNARARTLERLAQLEKENESLRERVRLMEAGQMQNLTLLVGEHFEQGCTPERLKELEEKLKLSELKNQRVEEVNGFFLIANFSRFKCFSPGIPQVLLRFSTWHFRAVWLPSGQ